MKLVDYCNSLLFNPLNQRIFFNKNKVRIKYTGNVNYWSIFCPVMFVLTSQLILVAAAATAEDAPMLAAQQAPDEGSNKEPCTEEEVLYKGCLSGGRCTAIDLGSFSRHLECECPEGWRGERCEMRDIPHDLWFSASIMVPMIILGVMILIAAVIGIPLIIYQRRRQQSLPVILQSACPYCIKSRDSSNQRYKQREGSRDATESELFSVIYTPDINGGVEESEKTIYFIDGDTGQTTSLTANCHRDDDDYDSIDTRTNKRPAVVEIT